MPVTSFDAPSTDYLHKGGVIRGKGRFEPVEFRPPFELQDEEYPLVLSTGRTLYHYNAATQTRRSEGLSGKQPEGFVEIHPKNARRMGVEDGQMVEVVTRRSRVKARAMLSRQVRFNAIWMPFHFPEMRTNELTVDAGDAVTGTGEYKVCAARIEPIAGAPVEKVFPGSYASI